MPPTLARRLLDTGLLVGTGFVLITTLRRGWAVERPSARELPHVLDDIGLVRPRR